MKTIFSKVKLKPRQIIKLFVLVLLSAVGQMLLPSFLAQMISHGVALEKKSVIFGVTTAAVLGMGAYYVNTSTMEVGSLVANSQYISMVLTSVMMLSLVIMMFPTSYACAKRIAEVLETVCWMQKRRKKTANLV